MTTDDPHEPALEGRSPERLLDFLDAGTALDVLLAGGLDDEESLTLEILAALPHALTPEAPDPRTRTLLLDRIASTSPAKVIPFRRSVVAAPVSNASDRRLLLALAASLAIVLLGSGMLGFHMEHRIQEHGARIETLQAELAAAKSAEPARTVPPETTAGVADAAIALYRVDVRATAAAPPQADGVVFLCAPHKHWYLSIRELDPAPQGMAYHLWFVTDQGPRHAGSMEAASAQIVHDHLPDDLRGILLTLETSDAPQHPGLPVLRGDQILAL